MIYFRLLICTLLCYSASEARRTDNTARCMKTGCTVSKLNAELNSMRGADDLVKVLSWNVEGIHPDTICRYLEQMELEVIGLQRVSIGQYYRLRACLKKYDATGVPNDVRSTSKTFNPIFYKKIRNVKTEVKMGTYGSLTWARLMFHVQQNRRYRRGVLSQNLLAILTGKTRQRKYARSVRKNYYRKQMFFANVDLDESDPTKKKTLHKLLHHLYFKVMDRRRYRVILFGTVGWESSTRMLSNYMRRRRRGSSVYISLFRRALKTSNSSSGMRDIMNQIWQSNVSSFRSVLTAVLDTKTRSKPTFSMFLV